MLYGRDGSTVWFCSNTITSKLIVGDFLGEERSYRSSVCLLAGHVVAVMMSMLLLVVGWLGCVRDTVHIRRRSESSVEVGPVRVGVPACSIVGVVGLELVPEVDARICIHVVRR